MMRLQQIPFRLSIRPVQRTQFTTRTWRFLSNIFPGARRRSLGEADHRMLCWAPVDRRWVRAEAEPGSCAPAESRGGVLMILLPFVLLEHHAAAQCFKPEENTPTPH